MIYAYKRDKRRVVGEIDILAKKGDYYDVYEVKCSHRVTKARAQLKKIKKNTQSLYKIKKMFFYCGNSANLFRILN